MRIVTPNQKSTGAFMVKIVTLIVLILGVTAGAAFPQVGKKSVGCFIGSQPVPCDAPARPSPTPNTSSPSGDMTSALMSMALDAMIRNAQLAAEEEAAAAAVPQGPSAAELKANELNQLGLGLMSRRAYAEAVSTLGKALKANPKNKEIQDNLARALQLQAENQTAIFEQLMRLGRDASMASVYATNRLQLVPGTETPRTTGGSLTFMTGSAWEQLQQAAAQSATAAAQAERGQLEAASAAARLPFDSAGNVAEPLRDAPANDPCGPPNSDASVVDLRCVGTLVVDPQRVRGTPTVTDPTGSAAPTAEVPAPAVDATPATDFMAERMLQRAAREVGLEPATPQNARPGNSTADVIVERMLQQAMREGGLEPTPPPDARPADSHLARIVADRLLDLPRSRWPGPRNPDHFRSSWHEGVLAFIAVEVLYAPNDTGLRATIIRELDEDMARRYNSEPELQRAMDLRLGAAIGGARGGLESAAIRNPVQLSADLVSELSRLRVAGILRDDGSISEQARANPALLAEFERSQKTAMSRMQEREALERKFYFDWVRQQYEAVIKAFRRP